jgi:hypothetical protein
MAPGTSADMLEAANSTAHLGPVNLISSDRRPARNSSTNYAVCDCRCSSGINSPNKRHQQTVSKQWLNSSRRRYDRMASKGSVEQHAHRCRAACRAQVAMHLVAEAHLRVCGLTGTANGADQSLHQADHSLSNLSAYGQSLARCSSRSRTTRSSLGQSAI